MLAMKMGLSNDAFYKKNIAAQEIKNNQTLGLLLKWVCHEHDFKKSKAKRCIFIDGQVNNYCNHPVLLQVTVI